MAGDVDAARELERLRAELMDFVVDAMAERTADGSQPALSEALVAAIDRQVDQSVGQAVERRVAETRWPDPEDFADAVADALARRSPRGGGGGGGDNGGVMLDPPRSRRPAPVRDTGGGANTMQIGFGLVIGLALIAAAAWFFFLRDPAGTEPVTNTVVVDTNGSIIPPPGNDALPPGNAAAPGSVGGSTNAQRPVG